MNSHEQKEFLKMMKAKFSANIKPVSLEPESPCTRYGTPGFKRMQELHYEAQHIRNTICHQKCVFSRTCGKKGQGVMDCSVVLEEQRGQQL